MSNSDLQDETAIRYILESVSDMTLATLHPDGSPHATTVSYVSDGLVLYFATSPNSDKVRNIAADPRVALTINRPYRFWKDILGLSCEGLAARVEEPAEFRRVGQLLFERYPEVHHYAPGASEDVALVRIDLSHVALLDYREGFGHTRSVTLKQG